MIYGAQFGGVRQQAANLGGSVGNYTAEQFKEEYPQFCNADGKCHLPDALLNTPIADRRRCEPKAIQSAVRRAAKGAWLTNPEYVQQLAGYPLTGAPSAVQFIEMLYNALVRAV